MGALRGHLEPRRGGSGTGLGSAAVHVGICVGVFELVRWRALCAAVGGGEVRCTVESDVSDAALLEDISALSRPMPTPRIVPHSV